MTHTDSTLPAGTLPGAPFTQNCRPNAPLYDPNLGFFHQHTYTLVQYAGAIRGLTHSLELESENADDAVHSEILHGFALGIRSLADQLGALGDGPFISESVQQAADLLIACRDNRAQRAALAALSILSEPEPAAEPSKQPDPEQPLSHSFQTLLKLIGLERRDPELFERATDAAAEILRCAGGAGDLPTAEPQAEPAAGGLRTLDEENPRLSTVGWTRVYP